MALLSTICSLIIPKKEQNDKCECSDKDVKNSKMIEKKVLTKVEPCGILKSLERETPSNDPWKRYRIKKTNARCDFHESHQNKDSQFVHEFWAWRRLQGSIQDLTQEFDPGSGRTLAACLTHASRAGMWKSLLWYILAADGWVTREQPASNRGITHRKMC